MAFVLKDFNLRSETSIGIGQKCFVIAEIGQNHQGSIDIAKKLIKEAKNAGADCVKFQKTCIHEKFNETALKRIYDGSHSWGNTYGEHKSYLEFSSEQFKELQHFATQNNIHFSSSAMDMISVDFLVDIGIPFLKIGSGDSNNMPMIEYAASQNIPLIISTGMIDKTGVKKIYETVKKYHTNFCLLHCVSAYPTPYEDCNLNVIKDYQTSFPDIVIGYSGHEFGLSITISAVALGAKVVERHFTLDKSQKGSDHSSSLTPDELKDLVNQIRIIEKALGNPVKGIAPSEKNCMDKLQKSLTTAHALTKGHIIKKCDLKIKVTEPKGMNGIFYQNILGSVLKHDKLPDQPIFETDFIV